ncbi:phage tail protein [Aetokthonos hydrillicola Thurmond2011]|jgi:phage tail-like protein|uniref:Phage tail protein n=1 Tax=Aetokthonos hydrillicola Thurmond2011 TaxID=2712845 RepID=A0AAP5IF20_9CYAN|nr:phage tail protein [Aetokthonos hydrillicola]MBO3460116.1 phage tail protein [Aetokthonos hydrillicola CCALA 1050]MBW4590732.1 phage tail protein [Aetokthonos hydrillicola CCALA 1050]MDR9899782.1 phage tail protein [Aetokthonos hydrillicola Thurmond2011]
MVDYPLPKFHFQVEWAGKRIGFTDVSGLNVETQPIEYREGNMREYSKLQMPGMQKFGSITMKRGTVKGDNDFFKWWNTVALNTIDRRDITISLLNEKHEPVVIWKVKNAWPTKVNSTELKSDGNEVAIESIEIVHEGLTIENN